LRTWQLAAGSSQPSTVTVTVPSSTYSDYRHLPGTNKVTKGHWTFTALIRSFPTGLLRKNWARPRRSCPLAKLPVFLPRPAVRFEARLRLTRRRNDTFIGRQGKYATPDRDGSTHRPLVRVARPALTVVAGEVELASCRRRVQAVRSRVERNIVHVPRRDPRDHVVPIFAAVGRTPGTFARCHPH